LWVDLVKLMESDPIYVLPFMFMRPKCGNRFVRTDQFALLGVNGGISQQVWRKRGSDECQGGGEKGDKFHFCVAP
jgi:hypothetical protein